MSAEKKMTGATLLSRLRLLDSGVAAPSAVIIVFYNLTLLDLSGPEWTAVGWSIGVYAALAAVCIEITRRRGLAPLLQWFEASDEERERDPALVREAFRIVVSLPRSSTLRVVAIWSLAPPIIMLFIYVVSGGHFVADWRVFALVSSGVLGAMISSAFVFFATKRHIADLRSELTAALPNAEERSALVVPTLLPRKVQYAVVGAVIGTSLLIVSLAESESRRVLREEGLDWQHKMLSAIDARVQSDGLIFEEAFALLVPDSDLLPFPTGFYRVPIRSIQTEDRAVDGAAQTVIEEDLRAGISFGHVRSSGAASTVAWRRSGPDDLLLAVSAAGLAGRASAGLLQVLLIAVAVAGATGLVVAYLLGDDFRRAMGELGEAADRMANGDLTPGDPWESEDELGALGRSFERMSSALRATVGRVSEAADRVDAAAGEISSVSQSVAVASADQVRRIQQANELMLQIKEQVGGVSGSAQALNVSVEESSSSILELGAAGDELNDTASVLSGKVDEVSGSIEQMVRSVKQVGSTTEGLSDAAGETSSSMEEMASAMRAVDNIAETTAALSTDVVSLSESGQVKVSETIEGMEAIRDATDAAERVIRGLGGRAKEIGGILDVIDDVADETNLLALNAAIIAAQAGEHGRAFSVVADEIKELADRVLASTKEIGGLIRSVQDESDNAIGAIEAGSASVATGVERSAEAGSSLEEITRAARESGDRIGQIVNAVREQTKATAHVAGLMEGVRTGVEQISTAGSEQDRGNEVVYRSAVTMREVAQQVRRTTEEQSRGFGRIRESVEGVREAVEQINGSLQEQSTACSQVASFLEQVFEGTRSNEEAAQRMGTSMRDLLEEAEGLREDVAKFQI